MNGNYDWTTQQWGRIKRTVKKVELVAFFPAPEFESSKRRIPSGSHRHGLHRKLIQPWHWVAWIDVHHQFTTRTNKGRQQSGYVTPYSGLVIPAGIKPYTHSQQPLSVLDHAILLAHISVQRFLRQVLEIAGKRRIAGICDGHVHNPRSVLVNQLPDDWFLDAMHFHGIRLLPTKNGLEP